MKEIKIHRSKYQKISAVKVTIHYNEVEKYRDLNWHYIGHIKIGDDINEYYLLRYPIYEDGTNVKIYRKDDSLREVTNTKMVYFADEANTLLKNGWELLEINHRQKDEADWDEFTLVQYSDATILDKINAQIETSKLLLSEIEKAKQAAIENIQKESDKAFDNLWAKFLKKLGQEALSNLCHPTPASHQNQPATIPDFTKMLQPFTDKMTDFMNEISAIKSQIGTSQTNGNLATETDNKETTVTVPENNEVVEAVISDNNDRQTDLSQEENHINELIDKYDIPSISDAKRAQMTGWTDEGRERYFYRKHLYERAREIMRTEMHNCGLEKLPPNEFDYWSKQFVIGNFDEKELRQKVQELPKHGESDILSGDNQAYVEAKKEVLEIANKTGFNQETAGEPYFQDIDSYAQQLASSEAADKNELMSNIEISFTSAVQNYEVLRKEVN